MIPPSMSNVWSRAAGAWQMPTAALVLSLAATAAPAQSSAGDSLIRAGRVFAAESLYFDAVRARPRDPAARLALGSFLAARGALKTGATLMEEARFFGGTAETVAEQLAPIYVRLGDYSALADLPGARLSPSERERVKWLKSNPPVVTGPDSGDAAWSQGDPRTLGRVMLQIGPDSVLASIDPASEGLMLDTAWARRKEVRRFTARGESGRPLGVAVVSTVKMGPYTLANLSAGFSPQRDRKGATIGLDLLGRFAPTFDSAGAKITLRKAGKIDTGTAGDRVAIFTTRNGTHLIVPDGTLPLGSAEAASVLGGRRWTLNAKRGEIVIHQ